MGRSLGSDFPDEYAHSKDTKVLRGSNEYAKANASVGIDAEEYYRIKNS